MSLIKGFFKLLFSPLFYLAASFRYLFAYITGYKSRIKQIKAIREERINDQDNPSDVAMMRADTQYFFSVWGVDERSLHRVIRGLTIDSITYTLVAILPVVGLLIDPLSHLSYFYWIGSIMTSPVCLFVATIRLWKASCLKNRQFVPFKEWFFGRSSLGGA